MSETTAAEKPNFIAAEKFEGSKPGYLFKRGDDGLGYYSDSSAQKVRDPFSVEEAKVWMYIGQSTTEGAKPEPKGPITLKELRGHGPTAAVMVWKPGLAQWVSHTQVIELQKWFYLDPKCTDNPRVGPCWVEDLAKAYSDGRVERLTQLWSEGMAEWKPLIELTELETYLDGIVARATAILAKQGASELERTNSAGVDDSSSATDGPENAPDKRKVTDIYDGPKAGEKTSYNAEDGTKYNWNADKKQWVAEEKEGSSTVAQPKRKRKKKPKKKRVKNDTSIYITGLDPKTVDEQELEKVFSKYGIIKTSLFTGGPSITLYRDDNEALKGDATIVYLRKESVDLAIQMMDGVAYRPGFKVSVQKAEWDKAKAGDGSKKKKKQMHMTLAEQQQLRKQIAAREKKLLSWADGPEDDDMQIVILKHCFVPAELKDEDFEADLKKDLRTGCATVGRVLKVSLMKFNPEGVAIVKFEDPEAAQACVRKMHGRFFNKRKLDASLWDGVTVYTVKESEESQKKRLDDFGKWLESMNDDDADGEGGGSDN